jgi:hypothetical protein
MSRNNSRAARCRTCAGHDASRGPGHTGMRPGEARTKSGGGETWFLPYFKDRKGTAKSDTRPPTTDGCPGSADRRAAEGTFVRSPWQGCHISRWRPVFVSTRGPRSRARRVHVRDGTTSRLIRRDRWRPGIARLRSASLRQGSGDRASCKQSRFADRSFRSYAHEHDHSEGWHDDLLQGLG